jgi:hypothetical protein
MDPASPRVKLTSSEVAKPFTTIQHRGKLHVDLLLLLCQAFLFGLSEVLGNPKESPRQGTTLSTGETAAMSLVSQNRVTWAVLLACYTLCATTAAVSAESRSRASGSSGVAETVDFERDILPVLAKHCFDCHGPDVQEARLRMDARTIVFRGGTHGPAVVPGKPDESLLVRRILTTDAATRMPLESDPLSSDEIGLIRSWIEQGANWPGGVGADVVSVDRHWAYVKPQRPPAPKVASRAWPRNAIDSFTLARLEKEKLSPAAFAAKERLIRRVTLDLRGTPPRLDEVDAFLQDNSPLAYEKLVDRLLASPYYGERWAIPWLDAARYTDSNGYQRDGRRYYWSYRDWVVRALNEDMPFDRFTVEQIAGDLLPNATLSQIVATGFHRGTMVNVEAGSDPAEEYVLAVIDRVNTTGAVWLGTTIECAQCHDHKYDPFSQEEFYRLYAFFNNTVNEISDPDEKSVIEFTGPKIEIPHSPGQQQIFQRLKTAVEKLTKDLADLSEKLIAEQPDWEQQLAQEGEQPDSNVPDEIRKIAVAAAEDRTEKQQKRLTRYFLARSEEFVESERRLKKAEAEFKEAAPTTTLVMKELPQPRMTRLFKRGDFLNPGEAVQSGTPTALHEMTADQTPDRLSLANWLVDEENPLMARVIVNRHWMEFFGRGLVDTPEDFGTQGARPTHPELLDWLATEFVRRNWSVKALHRLIVSSATYRQSARTTAEMKRRDPYNTLYTRGPRFRLKAELIRDNALALAGLLSDKMYGPPVFPFQPPGVWNHSGRASNEWTTSTGEDRHRRGLYVYWRRTVPYPSYVNFDVPRRETCSVERSRSNTPLQALTLLNDPVYFEAAVSLAARLMTEPDVTASPEERVAYGFRLATSRRPSVAEQDVLTGRYRAEVERYSSDPAAAKLLTDPWNIPNNLPLSEIAAWIHVSNILLNLDEVITKG